MCVLPAEFKGNVPDFAPIPDWRDFFGRTSCVAQGMTHGKFRSHVPRYPSRVAVVISRLRGLGQSRQDWSFPDQIVSGSFLSTFAISAADRADSMSTDFGAVAHSSG